ncbi:MAG TPA: FecR family protein, partial [Candidatus Angelobacter sp.]|nr:FecR family protein [Candidatus Angelobacter sp.]
MAPLSRAQSQDQDQEQSYAPAQAQVIPSDGSYDSRARIVRVSYVEGQVRIDTGHGYESATMNIPIIERTWLQTRSDGWAEVQLEDGSLIRLAPDTIINFTQLGRLSSGGTVTTIDLDQGEAEFKVAKHNESEFQVTVKNKTIVLNQSGSFRVTSTNTDPLEVVVWKGEVAVHDPESGGEVAIKKNETFALDGMDPGQYALDQGTEADQLDQWSKQRDDYLSTYASAGRSYPYQYGAEDLNQYGEYFDAPGYGTVWQPSGVNLGWDPFMNGYWTYSPGFGYTWVSAYPWGWLPYRYGNWVYVNNRGWCWAPGGWSRWHTGPRWVNAPPGFRPPVPPADRTIVISGAPGGRVVRPGTSGDSGGRGRNLGSGNSGPAAGRFGNNGGDDRGRTNRRVFTNDDVARV